MFPASRKLTSLLMGCYGMRYCIHGSDPQLGSTDFSLSFFSLQILGQLHMEGLFEACAVIVN